MRAYTYRLFVISVVVLISVTPLLAQQPSIVTAIVHHPDQYDGKAVAVMGPSVLIGNARQRLYDLSTGGRRHIAFGIRLEAPGTPHGQRVRVAGVFAKVKRVGQCEFRNEIEAQRVEAI